MQNPKSNLLFDINTSQVSCLFSLVFAAHFMTKFVANGKRFNFWKKTYFQDTVFKPKSLKHPEYDYQRQRYIYLNECV